MDYLKQVRNSVEDICYAQAEGIMSQSERRDIQNHLGQRVKDLASRSGLKISETDDLLICLSNFASFQEHCESYFAIELEIISELFPFIFERNWNPYRLPELVTGLREAIEHQRRNPVAAQVPILNWEMVINRIQSVYSDGAAQGAHLSGWSSTDRNELISELLKLMKQMIHFNRPKSLIEYLIANLLLPIDLLAQTAPDTLDLVFTLLGYFSGDDLESLIGPEGILWKWMDRPEISTTTWISPRIELHMLTVLAKLDPRHLSVVTAERLEKLFYLATDWIGLPCSATAPGSSTPGVETAGLYHQSGSLVGVDKRRVAGKFARVVVACIWSQEEGISCLGWKFLEIFSIRTQTILLPSITSKHSSGDEAKWPYRLSDVYTSLVHHWLRRKTKHDFLKSSSFAPNHSRFVQLLLPGVVNVVRNTMGGGVGSTLATRYVSVFGNLIRIEKNAEIETEIFSIASNTLSEIHKSIIHGPLVLAGITPMVGQIARYGPSEFLPFMLTYAVESMDATNLIKTTAILGFLDVLLIQTNHKWTLRDLGGHNSFETELSDQQSRFLMLSTTFPDLVCALCEKLLELAPQLPKAKSAGGGGAAMFVSALSSEGMEMMGRSLVRNIFEWIAGNVDESCLNRLHVLFQEFVLTKTSLLAEPGRVGLVGNLLTALMAEKLNQQTIDLFLKRINISDPNAKSNLVFVPLIGHAVRKIGSNVVALIPQIQSTLTALISSDKSSLEVKKLAVKVVQRVAESVCLIYITDRSSFAPDRIEGKVLISALDKEGTDLESSWWASREQSVKICIPNAVEAGIAFLNAMKSAVTGNTQLTCRILVATGKATQHVLSSVPDIRSELQRELLDMDPMDGDVKTTRLWLKAIRHLLPRTRDANGASETTNMILCELSGFRIENLLQFGYIGKEYESLDATRPEYIATRLEELISTIVNYRAGCRHLTETELALIKKSISITIQSRFDNIKVSGLLGIKGVCDLYTESDIGQLHAILEMVWETMMTTLNRPVEKHEADGIRLILALIGDVSAFIVSDSNRFQRFSNAFVEQLVAHHELDTELMESLLGSLRPLWSERIRNHISPATFGESNGCEQLLDLLETSRGLHWKVQSAILLLAYQMWRFAPGNIVADLTRLVALGTGVKELLVLWLEIVLIVHPTRLSAESMVNVFRVFSVKKRFSNRRDQSPERSEFMAHQMLSQELHMNLFSGSEIPRIRNRGCEERFIAFWSFCRYSQSDMESFVRKVLEIARDSTDDDVHCAALEVFAGVQSELKNELFDEFMEYIVAQTGRGDGSLVPTIGTAVRYGIVGLGHRSLSQVSFTPNYERIHAYLWKELTKTSDQSSSLLKSRLLVVLNNAVLIDLKLIPKLDIGVMQKYFMADLVNEATSEQVREIAAGVVARLCRVDPTAEEGVVRLANELVSTDSRSVIGEESLDNNKEQSSFKIQVKVAVVQLVARIIKFRRALPDWISSVVKLALECVGNPKSDIQQDGERFLELVARFTSHDQAVSLCSDSGLYLHSPREKEALIGTLSNGLINALTKPGSPLWASTCADDMRECVRVQLIGTLEQCLFVQHVNSPVHIDESTNPAAVSAACDALIDAYMLLVPCVGSQPLHGPDRPGSIEGILTLAACTYVSSLFYKVPNWGVQAIGKLALVLARDVPHNVKRLAQTTLADFLKTQTDRGTREETEKLFDTDLLALVRSSRSKHSYIS